MNKFPILLMVISTPAWARPDWVHHSERQVMGGDIIHWGTGEAETAEIALFKARQMAIQAMVEECGGVANKNIIPRKQYADSEGGSYRAFATVSLDFQSCEAARERDGKTLENPKTAEEQSLYQKMLGLIRDPAPIPPAPVDDTASQQIGALKEEIDALRAEMRTRPQPLEHVRLPVTNSMKVYCQTQARQMRANLMAKAADYNGNVMAQPLWGDFNAYQNQQALCQRME
jgi:hypothetical protein